MPYHVVKRGEKFCVEKQDGSKRLGCHETRKDALNQMAALYANEPEARHLHLLGATGQVRTEQYLGREHLVVPVVALMEGVIHAVNAETPEFVSAETLQRAFATWEGKPVTLGHPKKNGTQCSANSSEILESHGIGVVRNPRMVGKKMTCEAWIDKLRAKKLHPDMYGRLLDGKHEEVSVGAFVLTDNAPGIYNGKRFVGSWKETTGDHLAFLPGGRGACSIEMGCGAHRAAMRVCGERLEDVVVQPRCLTFSALEGEPLSARIAAVQNAVTSEWNEPPEPYAYATQVFDDFAIVCKGEETFKVPYTVAEDGSIDLGEPVAVKQQWVAASGALEALAGARHSSADMKAIQAVHDHATSLGALCDRTNYKLMSDGTQQQQQEPRAAEEHCGCSNACACKTVRSEGGRWAVYTRDGSRRLSTHDTKEQAVAQRQNIDERIKVS